MREAVLVAVMAVGTILLRFLPFIIFRKETPPYITYLGKVLPPAIIGMLVIYCLKDVKLTVRSFIWCWSRRYSDSDGHLYGAGPGDILIQMVIYMVLIQAVF